MSKSRAEAIDLFSKLETAAKDIVAAGGDARAASPAPAPKPALVPPVSKASGGPPKAPAAASKSPAKLSSPPVPSSDGYDESAIEVLEGLEPVRRRPGMYIGGTDERALHHLFAEVIDNAMDEAVAGHATFIDVELDEDGFLSVMDNGRGIPVGPHPKFPDKSTLEVIMCTLHAGGKFDSKVYETSGGLHGVGVSVVNALSELVEVEVARDRQLYRQTFSRGIPQGPVESLGAVQNRRGTRVRFKPDAEIFKGGAHFEPRRLFRMARSKAYLFGGVEIRWTCAEKLVEGTETPPKAVFRFPSGLKDYLSREIEGKTLTVDQIFAGRIEKSATGSGGGGHGSLEWAMTWFQHDDGFVSSYCNTIPTPEGGTHESGLRIALLRGLKDHAERTGQTKRAAQITTDDIMLACGAMLSVFIREPEFVGQTKDKLATVEASRIVENGVRDAFDHWLAASPTQATRLLDFVIERADDRLRRRAEKELARKQPTRKLRLPGKLADCSNNTAQGSELFIVEGDSAGGSAKQARNRLNQAVLPLRGKILNVANAGKEKIGANQQLADLILALGCGTGSHYKDDDLRYEKIVIMTDADVDGAHIASLLITFFYQQMPKLVDHGHLYLAVPPLFRLSHGGKTIYARDEKHRDALLKSHFKSNAKVEIGRFKGLGEMLPGQLKETTMDPTKRTLLRVRVVPEEKPDTTDAVERLMGNKPEARFAFIQERASFSAELVDV